jgi:ammonia channel protein AmtB
MLSCLMLVINLLHLHQPYRITVSWYSNGEHHCKRIFFEYFLIVVSHTCISMFAAVTATLIFGSVMERTSLRAFLVFLVFWSVFVYDIVAYWVWAQKGWLKQLGVLDFAGGIPVHIVTAFTSLA